MQENLITAQVSVVKTAPGKIWVRANSCDNCSLCNSGKGCRAKLFNIFSSHDKIFSLNIKKGHNYCQGDNLLLSCSDMLPFTLTFIIYFVSVLIFFALTAFGYIISMDEINIILLSLGGVIGYYFMLYIIKPKTLWEHLTPLKIVKIQR